MTRKRTKAEAHAIAASMRRFDPKLTDDQTAEITAAIIEARAIGKALNAKTSRLRNGDEPAGPFVLAIP